MAELTNDCCSGRNSVPEPSAAGAGTEGRAAADAKRRESSETCFLSPRYPRARPTVSTFLNRTASSSMSQSTWAGHFGPLCMPKGKDNELTILYNVCREAALVRGEDGEADKFAKKLYLTPNAGIAAIRQHLEGFPFDAITLSAEGNPLLNHVVSGLGTMLAVEHEYRLSGAPKPLITQKWPVSPDLPIFILGIAGSGTTLCQMLLSLDATARPLLMFEARYPVGPRTREHKIEKAKRFEYAEPRISKANMPDECNLLLDHALFPNGLQGINPLIKGRDEVLLWSASRKARSSMYAFHRRCAQVLYAKTGFSEPQRHWVFKDPGHMMNLDVLLEHYPDARIVWTHRKVRDIAFCDAGRVSMIEKMGNFRNGQILQRLSIGASNAEDAIRIRAASGKESQFYDVYFEDLVDDPIATTFKIYDYFKMKRFPTHEPLMRVWLKENFRKSRDYGLKVQDLGFASEESLRALYKTYVDRFPRTGL